MIIASRAIQTLGFCVFTVICSISAEEKGSARSSGGDPVAVSSGASRGSVIASNGSTGSNVTTDAENCKAGKLPGNPILTNEQVVRSTFATGGGRSSTAARVLLSSVGQTSVGSGNSGNYWISHGYWTQEGPKGCCSSRVGDANMGGEDEPTIGDVSVMIDAKFITGTCDGILNCLGEADINQSGGGNPTCDDITIGDISILIDYLFITGQSLGLRACEEWATTTQVSPKECPDVQVISSFVDATTSVSVSAPFALRAVRLELYGPDAARPICLLGDRLNLFYGQTNNQVRIAVIDIDGGETIPAGTTTVLRISGEYVISSATVVDKQSREMLPVIRSSVSDLQLPTDFALAQNYPNPFNPVTEITFTLPVTEDVRLEVFNVLGQKVATLIKQRLDAGEHSMIWDASAQASGVYLYRLTAGDFVETKKMLMLK